MTHIAHLIKTSSLVRIFLVVVLSLGMAWLIGSGLRMRNANLTTDFDQSAPAARSANGTLVTTDTSATSQTSVTSTTALDKAVRMLGGVDRTRNSTGGSNLAKSTNNQAVASNLTDANSAANPGTTTKVNNVATDPNQKSATNIQAVPGK